MNKYQIGQYLVWGGYASLAIAGVIAARHPAIVIPLVIGLAAAFVGRKLETKE